MKQEVLGEIGFESYKISCIMGCLPQERVSKQQIVVDLKVQVDITACIKTDRLDDTVDIMQLVNVCREIAKKQDYHLVEAYAGAVLQTLLKQFPINAAWIRVKKPSGVPSADFSFVELFQEKP